MDAPLFTWDVENPAWDTNQPAWGLRISAIRYNMQQRNPNRIRLQEP